MKRVGTILGALLIAAIIIVSGSAVANWAQSVYSHPNCTDWDEARFAPDGDLASVGEDGAPPILGVLTLDLGAGNEWGASQDFVVYGDVPEGINETYLIKVITKDWKTESSMWPGWDSEDLTFTTPSTPGLVWRYIRIIGTSGANDIWGPEIDAVGYY